MNDIIICRCEEVTLEHIRQAAEEDRTSAREIKLKTRAGMGYCGGRTCRPAVDKVLEEITGEKPGDDLPLKVQPPVRPTTLDTLIGVTNDDK